MPLTEEEKKERRLLASKKYYKENREKALASVKKWRLENKDSVSKYNKKHQSTHSAEIKIARSKAYKAIVDETTDIYIRQLICNKSSLSTSEIPQSMVNVKRTYIKGIRLIREQENEG